jgi:hypothetical protein
MQDAREVLESPLFLDEPTENGSFWRLRFSSLFFVRQLDCSACRPVQAASYFFEQATNAEGPSSRLVRVRWNFKSAK